MAAAFIDTEHIIKDECRKRVSLRVAEETGTVSGLIDVLLNYSHQLRLSWSNEDRHWAQEVGQSVFKAK